ncbi:MAG: ATP-binding protein [Actinomycetota bacterium]
MTARARSIDGRSFTFEAPIGVAVGAGTYVTISRADGTALLGQVLEVAASPRSTGGGELLTGRGSLLSSAGAAAFVDASLEPAPASVVVDHLGAAGAATAGIEIGNVQGVADAPARLQAKGFGRHTFLCGQSGSGKTYTLGLVLERLLLETDIRLVVLDPNSDYVNLARVRPKADAGLPGDVYDELVERYASISPDVHVFGGPGSERPLKARFGRLSFEQQTKVLGLDPLSDAEEYNAFVRMTRRLGDDYTLDDVLDAVQRSFDTANRRLGLRIDNMGVRDLSIWARDDQPVMAQLPDDWRVLIADLGSLGSAEERSISAAALLGFLWDARHARRPVIVVIDEAHNVCPERPTTANQVLATDHAIRIAGEGRKYGLYLLLSTQRPSKIHPNVLSQCDNLLLMKMNSTGDIATLTETFSYAPPSLVAQAPYFGLGEGLAAGKIAPDPLLFGSGRRLTVEGGSDVPSTWASPRSAG